MQQTVLVFTDSHSFCGVGQFNAKLLQALKGAGYGVICAQRHEATPIQSRLKELGVDYKWFGQNPEDQPNTFANDRMMPGSIFSSAKPDAIVFSNGHPQYGFAAVAVARYMQIPYVICEGLIARDLLPIDGALIAAFRRNYLGARQTVFRSEENRNIITSYFDLPADFGLTISPSAADIFFRPIDLERRQALRRKWHIPDHALLSMTVAKLERVKGHDIQLAAIDQMLRSPTPPDLKFIWAGEGSYEDDLRRHITLHGLADRVRLIGHVWNVAEILDAADLFVLTSYAEGLPHVIVEAMAKGLPVIATDVGGLSWALKESGTLLPAPADPQNTADELAAVFGQLSTDMDAHRDLGKAALDRALAHFQERREMAQFLEIVDAALAHDALKSSIT